MAKKIELTTAEAFYVEAHFGTQTPEEIAKDLGLPAKRVKDYYAKLEESGMEPKKTKTRVQKAGFEEKEGSVSMTESSSIKVDKLKRNRVKDFVDKRKGSSIHVIDPKKPVR